jgi:hypothetical protein
MIRAVVALTAVTTACTHQQSFKTLPDEAGKEVTVTTQNGSEFVAHVDVSPAGYGLREPNGQVVPFGNVREVVVVKRGRGALEGLGIGALIGAGTGAVMGLASGDDQCEGFCLFQMTAEEKAVVGGILMGSLGGLVGLVVGAVRGSRDVYSFGNEQQFKVTPTGPPGSVAGASVTF